MNTIKKIENISSESIAQDTIGIFLLEKREFSFLRFLEGDRKWSILFLESVYRKQFEELKGQFMELESTKNQLDSTVALYKVFDCIDK